MELDSCWVKVHFSKTGEVVVAVCDEELVGRKLKLSSGFTVEVDKSFYCGVLIPVQDLEKYVAQATIVNLLGERSVNYALKIGLASPETVIDVDGVPHIQVFL
ncbi:MAG: DUF424 family protein [Nitrososphaerota archaeon]